MTSRSRNSESALESERNLGGDRMHQCAVVHVVDIVVQQALKSAATRSLSTSAETTSALMSIVLMFTSSLNCRA